MPHRLDFSIDAILEGVLSKVVNSPDFHTVLYIHRQYRTQTHHLLRSSQCSKGYQIACIVHVRDISIDANMYQESGKIELKFGESGMLSSCVHGAYLVCFRPYFVGRDNTHLKRSCGY